MKKEKKNRSLNWNSRQLLCIFIEFYYSKHVSFSILTGCKPSNCWYCHLGHQHLTTIVLNLLWKFINGRNIYGIHVWHTFLSSFWEAAVNSLLFLWAGGNHPIFHLSCSFPFFEFPSKNISIKLYCSLWVVSSQVKVTRSCHIKTVEKVYLFIVIADILSWNNTLMTVNNDQANFPKLCQLRLK